MRVAAAHGGAVRMACGIVLISLCALTVRSVLRGPGPAVLFESVTMPCEGLPGCLESETMMPLLERVKTTMGKLKAELRHLHARTAAWRRRELDFRSSQRSTLANVKQVMSWHEKLLVRHIAQPAKKGGTACADSMASFLGRVKNL